MADAVRAGQLFAQGKFQAAASLYRAACSADPESADYRSNLAACCLELGHYPEAIEQAGKALEINPGHGYAYLNRADAKRLLGQMESAVADYEEALKLDPLNPVTLNKAGACMRLLENFDSAEAYFLRALQLAPGFSLARLNIGLLKISRGRADSGSRDVKQVIRDPKLDPEARQGAQIALAVLSEHRRLAPAMNKAFRTRQPGTLTRLLDKVPDELKGKDADCIDSLERLASSCERMAWPDEPFRYQADTSHLIFLEAYSNCKLGDDPGVMAGALAFARSGSGSIAGDDERDFGNMLRVCGLRSKSTLEDQLDEDGEAWIRYWHALLLEGESRVFPGQFKAVPNLISAHAEVPAVLPAQVAGTLRYVLDHIRPTVPEGIPRAIFMKIALVRLHPFKDGNGRLARFIFNWEMEKCGLHPLLVSPDYRQTLPSAMDRSILDGNVKPTLEAVKSIYRENEKRLEVLNRLAGPRFQD